MLFQVTNLWYNKQNKSFHKGRVFLELVSIETITTLATSPHNMLNLDAQDVHYFAKRGEVHVQYFIPITSYDKRHIDKALASFVAKNPFIQQTDSCFAFMYFPDNSATFDLVETFTQALYQSLYASSELLVTFAEKVKTNEPMEHGLYFYVLGLPATEETSDMLIHTYPEKKEHIQTYMRARRLRALFHENA